MLPSLSSLEEKRCLNAPEAGDSPALHGGSYPCLWPCVLWGGSPQGLTAYPECIRSLSPPKGGRLVTRTELGLQERWLLLNDRLQGL